GVAELFRQCLEQAQQFRHRRRRSGHRLLWTVGAAIAGLAGMATLATFLILGNQSDKPNPLLNKVENYRSHEGQTPSVRLRDDIQRKIGELTDLKNDPNFATLPPDQQEYVNDRLAELEAYQKYKEQLDSIRSVENAQNDEDLKNIREALQRMQVPEA